MAGVAEVEAMTAEVAEMVVVVVEAREEEEATSGTRREGASRIDGAAAAAAGEAVTTGLQQVRDQRCTVAVGRALVSTRLTWRRMYNPY